MKGLEPLQPRLADYELIDSGDGAKLERFGNRVVARPEPQALWRRSLPAEEWERLADATFKRSASGGTPGSGDERGQWQLKSGGSGAPGKNDTPERPDNRRQSEERAFDGWTMEYARGAMRFRMRLSLTGFKHVGVFPEQAANWDFIYDTLRAMQAGAGDSGRGMPGGASHPQVLRVLNLFAYTGGATLAARSAGAEVTHVDSVKQTVAWARDNAALSGLDGIRWIVDDALKFARREVRRGSLYDGIVLDPPAYGRGPDGEKWVLEQNLDEMLELCSGLLKPHGFLVFNLYSMGLSALVARTAVHSRFGEPPGEQLPPSRDASTATTSAFGDGRRSVGETFGELCFSDRAGKQLPLGIYYRFVR